MYVLQNIIATFRLPKKFATDSLNLLAVISKNWVFKLISSTSLSSYGPLFEKTLYRWLGGQIIFWP